MAPAALLVRGYKVACHPAVCQTCCTALSAACPTQDVLVLMQEPVVPMSFMRAKPIGVMGMIDQVGTTGCLRLASMGTVPLPVHGSPTCAGCSRRCRELVYACGCATLLPKLILALGCWGLLSHELCGVCLTHIAVKRIPLQRAAFLLMSSFKLLSTCLLCRESAMTKSLQCMQTTQARLCPLPGLALENFYAHQAVL